ncbi:MAG: phosphoglucosamine mutase [candidate division Zixibacteria bacterium]|nr:phosphoglucosamine mutase [candidate division Zixibacteria bacterium]
MPKKTLVKSISGIRGIIGQGLDPTLATQYGAAFGTLLKKGKVVVGRDSRPSGDMIMKAVIAGLLSVGRDVIEIDIVPTPTVEIAVKHLQAAGGMCITASHNPAQWNALKFFNRKGEFTTPAEYKRLDKIFSSQSFRYQQYKQLGKLVYQADWVEKHVRKTLAVKVVNQRAIKRRRFKVVVDAINGAGSVALPLLLRKLGVTVVELNCNGNGKFVHKPEPAPENLKQLSRAVRRHKADLGMACDPDADRLALVDETGHPIGEELSLAIAVKEVLKKQRGTTVLNLSTSQVTADIAKAAGSRVLFSKVGEANVVQTMHRTNAVVGGEGCGGVIYPAFHHGRDSLIGAAIVLSCLAEEKRSLSGLVETLPMYYAIRSKALLPDDFKARLEKLEKDAAELFGSSKIDRRDGLRFDFADGWAQVRISNTEPIFRLVVETNNQKRTALLARQILRYFK